MKRTTSAPLLCRSDSSTSSNRAAGQPQDLYNFAWTGKTQDAQEASDWILETAQQEKGWYTSPPQYQLPQSQILSSAVQVLCQNRKDILRDGTRGGCRRSGVQHPQVFAAEKDLAMLKRMQPRKTIRHSTISGPVFVETTLDNEAYSELADVGIQLNTDVEWKPQMLNSERQQPPQANRPRPSYESQQSVGESQKLKFRPASSVYSQPTPNDPNQQFPRQAVYTDNIEISPPSSPELEAAFFSRERYYTSRGDDVVSPIVEESPEERQYPMAPPQKNFAEMRRDRKRQEAAARNAETQHGNGRRIASAAPGDGMNGNGNGDSNTYGRRTASATAGDGMNGNGLKKNNAAPKYDPYTGEPTADETKGRAQSVKPSTFNPSDKPVHNRSDDSMGTRTLVTANVPLTQTGTTFSERLRKLRERNVVVEESRPSWKGSSGRQNIIDPPTQPKNTKPFSLPRKTTRRATEPELENKNSFENLVLAEKQKTFDNYDRNEKRGLGVHSESDESILTPPTPPTGVHPALRGKIMTPRSGSAEDEDSQNEDSLLQYQIPPQDFRRGPKGYVREEKPSSPKRIEDLHDISVGVVERNFREALRESNLTSNNSNYPDGQLPSKFSVTTYDPSTYQNTPRPSTSDENRWDAHAAPPLPNSSPHDFPIVDRTRPRVVSGAPSTASSIVRKPVPQPLRSTSNPVKTSDQQKPLPQSPAEKEASKSQELIPRLNARQEELRRRRINIEAAIKQMTELMPQDGLMGGIGGAFIGGGNMRHHVIGGENFNNSNGRPGLRRGRSIMGDRFTEKRREEEKLKVEELRSELADVRKEEYEVGLKLHRAYKRGDDLYYTSPLWVKRVQG